MAVGWALLADSVPLYALYALLFEDAGLSAGQISSLFLLWSATGIVAEVPSGALADRFSRRHALVASGVLQALGYVLWLAAPGYPAFAAGFVLWGLGGAFASGALAALLYDGLAAAGAEDRYPAVYGYVSAAGLVAQVPVALAATVLFATGGYQLVGWVSVGCCLASAALAARLPEAPRDGGGGHGAGGGGGREPGYLSALRSGLAETVRRPAVRAAVVAVALVGALDGLEEYFSLLARDWGVATPAVPLALLAVPVAGAAGAAAGGRAARLRPGWLAAVLGAAVAIFGAAALVRRPAGVVAIAAAYFLYQLVVVVVDARLQDRIEGPARATVTSVASLATDIACIALYAAWGLGQPGLIAAMAVVAAVALPRLLRPRPLSAGAAR
ncbi:MAG TPA: MFS transporter [Acidimicrobiales bacterium]|nr:MFS transporter [Acidimicrobiales bacterium]